MNAQQRRRDRRQIKTQQFKAQKLLVATKEATEKEKPNENSR